MHGTDPTVIRPTFALILLVPEATIVGRLYRLCVSCERVSDTWDVSFQSSNSVGSVRPSRP